MYAGASGRQTTTRSATPLPTFFMPHVARSVIISPTRLTHVPLDLVRSLILTDAEESKPGATDQVIHHATLRLSNAAIRCVHLPAEFDAPELMISRLRAIDRGRHRFRKRVQLQPKARPERHAPIVSANVTEADAFGT